MSAFHSDSFLSSLAGAGQAMLKGMPVADGRLHRYRVEGDKAGSKNGWYVLHLDDKPFGAFGSWKSGRSETWTATSFQAMTETERQTFSTRMAEAKRARDAEQVAVHAAAAQRAQRLWATAKPATNDNPYLSRKGVCAYGIRALRDNLVIPLRNAEGALCSLQFITPEGDKRFLTGGRKRGCYCAIGTPVGVLCICEGYATAASIYEATGHAVAIAFDAGNLGPVALVLRGKFPLLQLTLCADNDSGTPGNPGLRYADAAARAVRGFLAVPSFDEVGQ